MRLVTEFGEIVLGKFDEFGRIRINMDLMEDGRFVTRIPPFPAGVLIIVDVISGATYVFTKNVVFRV